MIVGLNLEKAEAFSTGILSLEAHIVLQDQPVDPWWLKNATPQVQKLYQKFGNTQVLLTTHISELKSNENLRPSYALMIPQRLHAPLQSITLPTVALMDARPARRFYECMFIQLEMIKLLCFSMVHFGLLGLDFKHQDHKLIEHHVTSCCQLRVCKVSNNFTNFLAEFRPTFGSSNNSAAAFTKAVSPCMARRCSSAHSCATSAPQPRVAAQDEAKALGKGPKTLRRGSNSNGSAWIRLPSWWWCFCDICKN